MTTPAPLKTSPLLETTLALGAVPGEAGGWRLAHAFGPLAEALAAARDRVALADSSAHGKLQLEGAQAAAVARAAFGAAPEAVGAGLSVPAGQLYRLRPELFYLSTPTGGEAAALAQAEAAARQLGAFVTVSDLSHGLADLRLIGPHARAVLGRLCALDLSAAAFPDQSARQTEVAKTRQLILRRDFGPRPAFQLIGAQSLAAYVWEAVLAAGREFGLQPIGVAALRELEPRA